MPPGAPRPPPAVPARAAPWRTRPRRPRRHHCGRRRARRSALRPQVPGRVRRPEPGISPPATARSGSGPGAGDQHPPAGHRRPPRLAPSTVDSGSIGTHTWPDGDVPGRRQLIAVPGAAGRTGSAVRGRVRWPCRPWLVRPWENASPTCGDVSACRRRDLASEVCRSESWVSQVERDVLPVERVSVLQSLADALGAAVRDLRPEAVESPASCVAAPDELGALRLAMTGHPALSTLLGTAASVSGAIRSGGGRRGGLAAHPHVGVHSARGSVGHAAGRPRGHGACSARPAPSRG